MKVGIGFPAKSYTQIGEYVNAAATYPFESIICYGDLGDLPPYLALGMHRDQLVESPINLIGPLGTPVGRMDAELLGTHARLFEQAFGAKALAGLVRGAFLGQIGATPAPLAAVSTAIDHVREQAQGTKIAIGGFGPKIIDLAIARGVEYIKLGGSANPTLAKQVVTTSQERSASAVFPKVILGAVTVVASDRATARNRARHEVAKYLAIVGQLDSTLDLDQRDSLSQFQQAYTNQESDSANKISDSLLDAFSYSGTPDDIYQRTQELRNHPYIDHIQFGTPHGIKSSVEGVTILGEIALAAREKTDEI